eukprot:scaffold19634_cov96-Amphora_coffeaeformis.AAC.2
MSGMAERLQSRKYPKWPAEGDEWRTLKILRRRDVGGMMRRRERPESAGEAVIGIGGQGGKDVMEFGVRSIPGSPFGWGGEAGLQDAGDNILQGCAGVVEEVGEVGVDEGRGKGSGREAGKGGAEEMRGGVVGKVEAWIEDVLVRG